MIHVIKVAGAISWILACLENVQYSLTLKMLLGMQATTVTNLIVILCGPIVPFLSFHSLCFRHENQLASSFQFNCASSKPQHKTVACFGTLAEPVNFVSQLMFIIVIPKIYQMTIDRILLCYNALSNQMGMQWYWATAWGPSAACQWFLWDRASDRSFPRW